MKEVLEDILCSANILNSINNNLDVLLKIIPELKDMIGFSHKHPHHHLDVWEHTLLALSISINQFDIRLVLLLHDIGKPHSYQDGEIRHFKNHPKVSSNMSIVILKRLGFSDEYINYISTLILKHDTEILDNDIENNFEFIKQLFKIQYCDALAHHPEKLNNRKKYLLEIAKKIVNKDKEYNFGLNLLNKNI